jgi:hypothetical protein
MITLAVAGLMAVTLLPAAHAAKQPKQTEVGTIIAPLPFTDDTGCYAGVWRRAHAVTGDPGRGPIGWNFAVNKATWNKKFNLEVSGGVGSPDMDIYFYMAPLTTTQDFIDQQGDPVAPATISFNTRAAGGEKGTVPKGAQNAIICMYAGAQGQGGGADFTYTAG